ncbi:MAG: hypothetical protein FWC97_06905 [Treponema sp.]|nr:hypothetical protein [Treponema sp.]
MKKAVFLLFLPIFLFPVSVSFAFELPNRRIYIEGTAFRSYHVDYFITNFTAEALGTGHTITEYREEAGFIFSFNVALNPDRDFDHNVHIISISLINNTNDIEVLNFDFYFTHLEDMYQYNQALFLRAANFIPPITEEDLRMAMERAAFIDTSWRDKIFYLRMSFDHPIAFYLLQPDGLFGGSAVYAGDINSPDRFNILENRVVTMPGVTIGLEAQIFNFMILAANFQFSLGGTFYNNSVNTSFGTELKFPIKRFSHLVIAPYFTVVFPLNDFDDVFQRFPDRMFGGGIQIGTRGGRNGVFFVDLKFLTANTNAIMHNQLAAYFPNPGVIHYRRILLGLGIGYKHGFIDRNQRRPITQLTPDHIRIFDFH